MPVAAVVAAAVVLVAIIGAIVVVASSSGGGDDDTASGDAEVETVEEPATTTTEAPTTTAPATTAAAATPDRQSKLYSGLTKLRQQPTVNSAQVAEFPNAEGITVDILEELGDHGWYRARVNGTEGYLFGAFVLDPSPGWCIAKTANGEKPYVYDQNGSEVGAEKTGDKVLLRGSADPNGSWATVLPGGERGYVAERDLIAVTCG